jgi:hypothetical protein
MDMLRGGFYDKSDGSITDKGVNLWKKRLAEASEPDWSTKPLTNEN